MSAIAVESEFVVDPGVRLDPVVLTVVVDPTEVQRQKEEVTAALFREAVSQAVRTLVSQGARVEFQTDYSAIVLMKRRGLIGGYKRRVVSIDSWGYTHVEKL